MLVTMTHENLPGVTKVVPQASYRYTWWPEGWRSADDPDWVGPDLTPRVPHATDASLHGGGIELDYAEIAEFEAFTATGFDTEQITGLTVAVPDIPRPAYLIADVRVGPVTTTSDLTMGLSPVAGTGSGGVAAARNGKTLYAVPAVGVEAGGRAVTLVHRLPAGTPAEDWCVVGVINSGASTARVLGAETSKSSLRLISA